MLLTSLIVAWSAVTVLSSATTINGILQQAQIYEFAALQTQQSISQTAAIPAQYQPIFQQSVKSALTAARLEEIFQPLLVDIVTWLNQPAGTAAPHLVVNITPVKAALVASMQQSSLSATDKSVAIAQVNQQLPDQFDLAQAQGLSVGSSGQLNTTTSGTSPTTTYSDSQNPIEQSLTAFKTTYSSLKTFTIFGTLALLLMTAVLVLLTRAQGRTMLRRPAWVFLNAGILTLVIWALVIFVAPKGPIDMTNISQSSMKIAGVLAREAMGVMAWYGLVSLLIGGVLYGLSFFIRKPNTTVTPVSKTPPAMPKSSPR